MKPEQLHAAWPTFIKADGKWNIDTNDVRTSLDSPTVAEKDGWGIYGFLDSEWRSRVHLDAEYYTLQSRRSPSTRPWKHDEEGWVKCWQQARDGYERACAALFFLRHCSPKEYAQIRAYCEDKA